MNLSMKWLSDFVKLKVEPREFSEKMSLSGSKVEGYETICGDISGVVCGKILEISRHPNAERLVICKVDIGRDEPIQVITAATNVLLFPLQPTVRIFPET